MNKREMKKIIKELTAKALQESNILELKNNETTYRFGYKCLQGIKWKGRYKYLDMIYDIKTVGDSLDILDKQYNEDDEKALRFKSRMYAIEMKIIRLTNEAVENM